jgi:hypothetical protein
VLENSPSAVTKSSTNVIWSRMNLLAGLADKPIIV